MNPTNLPPKRNVILLITLIVLSTGLILYAGIIFNFYLIHNFSLKILAFYFAITLNALLSIYLIIKYGLNNKQVFNLIENLFFGVQLFLVALLLLIVVKYDPDILFLVLVAVLFGFLSLIFIVDFLIETKNHLFDYYIKKAKNIDSQNQSTII
jgi:hypothetical protein